MFKEHTPGPSPRDFCSVVWGRGTWRSRHEDKEIKRERESRTGKGLSSGGLCRRQAPFLLPGAWSYDINTMIYWLHLLFIILFRVLRPKEVMELVQGHTQTMG